MSSCRMSAAIRKKRRERASGARNRAAARPRFRRSSRSGRRAFKLRSSNPRRPTGPTLAGLLLKRSTRSLRQLLVFALDTARVTPVAMGPAFRSGTRIRHSHDATSRARHRREAAGSTQREGVVAGARRLRRRPRAVRPLQDRAGKASTYPRPRAPSGRYAGSRRRLPPLAIAGADSPGPCLAGWALTRPARSSISHERQKPLQSEEPVPLAFGVRLVQLARHHEP